MLVVVATGDGENCGDAGSRRDARMIVHVSPFPEATKGEGESHKVLPVQRLVFIIVVVPILVVARSAVEVVSGPVVCWDDGAVCPYPKHFLSSSSSPSLL